MKSLKNYILILIGICLFCQTKQANAQTSTFWPFRLKGMNFKTEPPAWNNINWEKKQLWGMPQNVICDDKGDLLFYYNYSYI